MKGFAPRKCDYVLRIFAPDATYPVEFFALWDGSQEATDKRANDVATCVWAIARHGANCAAYAEMAEALGTEFAEQLTAIHEQLDGQQFTGKLRAKERGGKRRQLITVFASEMGLVEGLKEYYPADHVKRLA